LLSAAACDQTIASDSQRRHHRGRARAMTKNRERERGGRGGGGLFRSPRGGRFFPLSNIGPTRNRNSVSPVSHLNFHPRARVRGWECWLPRNLSRRLGNCGAVPAQKNERSGLARADKGTNGKRALLEISNAAIFDIELTACLHCLEGD